MVIKFEIPDKLAEAAKKTFGYQENLIVVNPEHDPEIKDSQPTIEVPNPISVEGHVQQWFENFIFGELRTNIRAEEEKKIDETIDDLIKKDDIKNPDKP